MPKAKRDNLTSLITNLIMSPKSINPTSLAQYIRFDNCDRFLRFRLSPEDERYFLRKWNLTIQPLTPLLQEAGADFELNVGEHIAGRGEQVIDMTDAPVEETIQRLKDIQNPTILLQPTVHGSLGVAKSSGRADAIRIERNKNGSLGILTADIKATRQERMEHRLQVAVYANLINQMAESNGVKVAGISGAVLTMQDDGSIPALSPETPTFDLDTYLKILDRLAVLPDCKVNQLLSVPFEQVFFHLSYKCDGCLYNALCMYDSAERMDIALTPAITAVEKRVLNEVGICTLQELANLMQYPSDGTYQMVPNSQCLDKLDIIRNRWPVAPNIPFLVQRAKAAYKVFNKNIDQRSFLLGSGFGTLPCDEEHPGLVKIFFDAQQDYLKNRVYLLSGLIVGPGGTQEVVRIAPTPPTDEDESYLLRSWIIAILTAARQVANSDQAPVHLYCYNRYDQKVLLESLKRHLDDISTLPAFFDLLTQTPALSQSVISFLYDELRERSNLGLTCLPLHDAARRIGFDWKDEKYEYFSLFRARMFDNRRTVIRDPGGNILPLLRDTPADDPRRLTIEAASRFNSQIPLEYAYAAWNKLPDIKEGRNILEPFKAVDLPALISFASMRVKALYHIEKWFKVKARFLEKPLIALPNIGQGSYEANLRLSLEEYLFIEHHASLQEHLLGYSLPVDRRVQSGRAMMLKHVYQIDRTTHLFRPDFSSIGLDPELTMNACKVKEGDWVVMNDPSDPQLTANKIKNGRLAMVDELTSTRVVLKFMDNVQGRGKIFCYFHNTSINPQPGGLYVLDDMVDDLNADKVLESLRNIESNVFFRWLSYRPTSRPIPNSPFFQQFIGQIDALLAVRKRKLTASQRKVIGETLAHPLALVQGPPGTGKSYTLAWAILGRVAAASVQGCPCRVAVCCKTHNAIKVVLKALGQAKQQLTGFGLTQLGGNALRNLQIYKIGGEDDGPAIPGVTMLDVYNEKDRLPGILNMPIVILGATSGGLFNLMRYSSADGRHVNWDSKPFDLLVIDEASQMSIPEGVLAGAFLKPDGQMIVVGDHRQMPPINTHPWKEEEKRDIVEMRPFLSLFESLVERDFPREALDESFRLHEDIAEFLNENIYFKDGIQFHSKRKELITPLPAINGYVDAVMNPAYPIVVIEHTENASQQFNPSELLLTEPIIQACVQHLGLDGRNGIGVVVPHRAQRALLCQRFPDLADVRSIDTVERFQGDERDVIIVSATASDPDYVLNEADFLLNLNRLNVAISRPRKKLIVIASRSVIDLLTSDLEIFENSILWKRLYYHFAPELLYRYAHDGTEVFVKGRRCKQ